VFAARAIRSNCTRVANGDRFEHFTDDLVAG
jgi:hypothetical protein